MKKFALAAAFAGAASTAFAGNVEAPVLETTIPTIVETTEASSSSKGIWIPLVIVAIIAAVAAD